MRAPSRVVPMLALVLVLGGCVGDPGAQRQRRPSGVSAAPASLPASDVLHDWDRARARALAAGDVAALRRLYVDGSVAGTSDVRMLRDFLRRGLRVEGMGMQVLAIEVLHEDGRRLRLLVTDRLAGAVAVGRTSRLPLPQDQPSARVVELRRDASGAPWRMAFVRASSRTPAAR